MRLQELFLKENTVLDELTHYKKLPAYHRARSDFADTTTFMAADEGKAKFDKFMQDNGFKQLGSGAFANVYERPGYPWVFKIFSKDPAYLAWLEYVAAHQNNEHVPKLRGKPFKINNDTFAIRMEKLTDLPGNWRQNVFLDAIVGGVPLRKHVTTTLIDAGHPDLLEVLSAINDIAYVKRTHTADLHAYNVMMRGNTPVITDPLV